MFNLITENKRGLKAAAAEENLPNSCAADIFYTEDKHYLCCICTEYTDPFFERINNVPNAVVKAFYKTVMSINPGEAFDVLFTDFYEEIKKIGNTSASLDGEYEKNLSFCFSVTDTEDLKTFIGCHGSAHRLITDKSSGEIEPVWPQKKCKSSIAGFAFMLGPENNILLCNEGLWQNIYNIRDKVFYSSYCEAICSPLKDIFYTRSLNSICYIAVDLNKR